MPIGHGPMPIGIGPWPIGIGHGPMPIVTAYANRINSCMCAVVITHCYSSAAQDYTLDYFVLSYASDNELYVQSI